MRNSIKRNVFILKLLFKSYPKIIILQIILSLTTGIPPVIVNILLLRNIIRSWEKGVALE